MRVEPVSRDLTLSAPVAGIGDVDADGFDRRVKIKFHESTGFEIAAFAATEKVTILGEITGQGRVEGGEFVWLDRRIRSSVNWQMEEKGLRLDAAAPDLLVVYHAGAQEKIQVTDWGYRYSDYYWGYGGRQIDVYQYTEGMLVIDIVDAGTKNLVWRGIGQKVIDRTQRSPEEVQERIDGIVNKIMALHARFTCVAKLLQ